MIELSHLEVMKICWECGCKDSNILSLQHEREVGSLALSFSWLYPQESPDTCFKEVWLVPEPVWIWRCENNFHPTAAWATYPILNQMLCHLSHMAHFGTILYVFTVYYWRLWFTDTGLTLFYFIYTVDIIVNYIRWILSLASNWFSRLQILFNFIYPIYIVLWFWKILHTTTNL